MAVMKKASKLIVAAIVSVVSCSKDVIKNDQLYGKWQLVEYYADPGDGSGTWHAPEQPSAVEFTKTGKFIQYNNINVTWHFTVLSDSALQLNTNNSSQSYTYRYKLKDDNTILFLYRPCTEGCGYKYRAINK